MSKGRRPPGASGLPPRPRTGTAGESPPAANSRAVDSVLPASRETDESVVGEETEAGGPDHDGWDHGLILPEPSPSGSSLTVGHQPRARSRATPRFFNFLKW